MFISRDPRAGSATIEPPVPAAPRGRVFTHIPDEAGVEALPAEARMGASDANDWLSRTPLIVLAGRASLLLTLFLLLVFDIDRPNSGNVREEQGPMLQLKASLHDLRPAVFDRYRSASVP